MFHLGFTSILSSSLSDEWEEAYEELCSSADSSLSESESSEHQEKAENQVGVNSLLILFDTVYLASSSPSAFVPFLWKRGPSRSVSPFTVAEETLDF